MLEELLSLVAPPLCAVCGDGRSPSAIVCDRCQADLAAAPRVVRPGPPGVDLAVAASPFEGVGREIVHALKYSRRLAIAELAAEAMLRALPASEQPPAGPGREAEEPALKVVPVPAGPWRWRWRGFDPAEELAIAVAGRATLPHFPCLRRAGGRRQVGRHRSQRLADPPRVWATAEAPRDALLIDDVWTTGATLSACARALREGGCRRVVALTLAHAL